MQHFDIYNPTQTPRVIYDGIEGSQRSLRLGPGDRLFNVPLGQAVVDTLRSRSDDLVLYTRGNSTPLGIEIQPRIEPIIKTPVILIGMWGIGDNLHQRAAIRELMKYHEVWLETCHYMLYHDLIEQGLKLIFRPTKLRAQARTIEREKHLFPDGPLPPNDTRKIKLWYKKQQVDTHGSILASMLAECGVATDKPDFSLPIPPSWRDKALKLIESLHVDKPLMIYRPIVQRKEWNGASRNPEPKSYEKLFEEASKGYFVLSIADLEPNKEWIVGDMPKVDAEIHDGSIDFETMAALFKEASLVFCNAGFAPVLAQSVGTPSIVVYGGRESFRTTQAAGAHLAPTLGIDPINPCNCHTELHNCDKRIDMVGAIPRVAEFSRTYVVPKPRTLIFATTYVDSKERVKLTDQWLTMMERINPDCDLLIVDSDSPFRNFIDAKHGSFSKYEAGKRSPRMLHDFGDNVGHLSRKGRDGWGRAFCFGLTAAAECGYDYAVHIEGDSLFKLKVSDITAQMKKDGTAVASIPVKGMKSDFPTWVETGLMFFSTKYIRESGFVEKYNWPIRQERPTPEIIVKQLIGDDLKLMPWKGLRGDKAQVTNANILSLNLDWVTHCHNDIFVYDKFMDSVLGASSMVVSTTSSGTVAKEDPTRIVKLNLGCGENRLEGWDNHDADVDISKRLPYADNYANFIFCEHCVEHIQYKDAVAFFKECHRVLKPGGVVRITVPSLEQIYKSDNPGYWKFTTKFQPDATKRGAMHNIIFKHGHQTCWSASLLEATLYYAGFETPIQCEVHKSAHTELNYVEGHHKIIGEEWNSIESLSFEGTKGGQRIAVIVGGGKDVWEERELAKKLCGTRADYFVINDMIANFQDEATAITLHPTKLKSWLTEREKQGFVELKAIWGHRSFEGITNHVEDWGGSGGLFAIKVARQLGYSKIILCGVPMTVDGGHFVRDVKWNACVAFKRAWETHRSEISPYVRSFSGWTSELFGKPDEEFLK